MMGDDDVDDVRMDLETSNPNTERIAQLKQLFPEAFTDGSLNVSSIAEALGLEEGTGSEDCYEINWAGKSDSVRQIQIPSAATLRPNISESNQFDSSDDIVIIGDNLEVLKLLQKSYYDKVKMIYIDPPYNTGNEFIYNDDFTENIHDYLDKTGQIDDDGNRTSLNIETRGRKHSGWLSMMYPRLVLSRNLLSDQGVIFVSIDDNEVANLKLIMDEIFGPENFISQIVVHVNPKGRVLRPHIATNHEYILIYSKFKLAQELSIEKSEAEIEKDYPLVDDIGPYRQLELRNTHRQFGKHNRRNLWYPLYVDSSTLTVSSTSNDVHSIEVLPIWPDGFEGCWTWSSDKVERENNKIVARMIGKQYKIFRKGYAISDDGSTIRKKLKSIWNNPEYYTEKGQRQFDSLIPGRVFQSPKPVGLIRKMIEMATEDGDLVLDFFAGSGTTAQAVLEESNASNKRRNYIIVQFPEPCDHENYSNIAQITVERVRKVTEKYGTGFRLFSHDSSNFDIWNRVEAANPESDLREWIEGNIDHRKDDRTSDDVLWEIGLKSGCRLNTMFSSSTIAGAQCFYDEEIRLMINLDDSIPSGFVESTIRLNPRPRRLICLDSAFAGNDQDKMNAILAFKDARIEFRTV